jgi:CopG antitoxin of type II toxin-antitoxin system
MKTEALPQTDSIQELAQFWDTHDVTDFENELEEVSETVFERPRVLALDLESEEAEAVKRLAQSKGLEDAELIRGWIREKISAN